MNPANQGSSQFTADGFRLAPVGGNRNLIDPAVGNELVSALNALGKIELVINETGPTKVFYSQGKIIFQIKGSDVVGAASLTVAEVDGSPSVASVTTIKFPNGSVTNEGSGVVAVAVAASLTVAEVDGSPSVASVTTIKFPNGSVTNEGSGVVAVTFAEADAVTTLRVKEIFSAYLRCRTWDGSSEGGSDILVAKPTVLQTTPNWGEDNEAHRVDPPYAVDGLIWAAEVGFTGVAGKTWIDLNVEARVWLAQTEGCDAAGDPQYAFFHRTAWSDTLSPP
jgi:hypothetical protein